MRGEAVYSKESSEYMGVETGENGAFSDRGRSCIALDGVLSSRKKRRKPILMRCKESDELIVPAFAFCEVEGRSEIVQAESSLCFGIC